MTQPFFSLLPWELTRKVQGIVDLSKTDWHIKAHGEAQGQILKFSGIVERQTELRVNRAIADDVGFCFLLSLHKNIRNRSTWCVCIVCRHLFNIEKKISCIPDMKSENGISTLERDWVVQKYGGTSIGKFPSEIAEIICHELERNRLAVVCSARSSGIKADGTTTKQAYPPIKLRQTSS